MTLVIHSRKTGPGIGGARHGALAALVLVLAMILLPVQAPGAGEAGGVAGSEQVRAAADTLYGKLVMKEAGNANTREEIKPLFEDEGRIDEAALTNFIVEVVHILSSKAIKYERITGYSIGKIEISDEGRTAAVEMELRGRWILFFNRTLEKRDVWKYYNSKWHIVPPEKLKP